MRSFDKSMPFAIRKLAHGCSHFAYSYQRKANVIYAIAPPPYIHTPTVDMATVYSKVKGMLLIILCCIFIASAWFMFALLFDVLFCVLHLDEEGRVVRLLIVFFTVYRYVKCICLS